MKAEEIAVKVFSALDVLHPCVMAAVRQVSAPNVLLVEPHPHAVYTLLFYPKGTVLRLLLHYLYLAQSWGHRPAQRSQQVLSPLVCA